MNSPVYSPASMIVMMAAAVLLAIVLRRTMRARARARRRIVEQPNSHYTSQLVRDGETRHRWHAIDLDRIHEINRGEVSRLLARVEASGVDALRESERVFLDQFVHVEPTRAAAAPRAAEVPLASDLRHRPA